MTAEDVSKATDEQLARALLLWAGGGDPHGMHLVMSPSFPGRETFIKNLAAFGRRPEIAAQLPGPEILAFFQEPPPEAERKAEIAEILEGAAQDFRNWAEQQADEKMKGAISRMAEKLQQDAAEIRTEVEGDQR